MTHVHMTRVMRATTTTTIVAEDVAGDTRTAHAITTVVIAIMTGAHATTTEGTAAVSHATTIAVTTTADGTELVVHKMLSSGQNYMVSYSALSIYLSLPAMLVLWRLECYFVVRENGNGPSKHCYSI